MPQKIFISCEFRQNSVPYVNSGSIMNALSLLLFALSFAHTQTQIRKHLKGNIQRLAKPEEYQLLFLMLQFLSL